MGPPMGGRGYPGMPMGGMGMPPPPHMGGPQGPSGSMGMGSPASPSVPVFAASPPTAARDAGPAMAPYSYAPTAPSSSGPTAATAPPTTAAPAPASDAMPPAVAPSQAASAGDGVLGEAGVKRDDAASSASGGPSPVKPEGAPPSASGGAGSAAQAAPAGPASSEPWPALPSAGGASGEGVAAAYPRPPLTVVTSMGMGSPQPVGMMPPMYVHCFFRCGMCACHVCWPFAPAASTFCVRPACVHAVCGRGCDRCPSAGSPKVFLCSPFLPPPLTPPRPLVALQVHACEAECQRRGRGPHVGASPALRQGGHPLRCRGHPGPQPQLHRQQPRW
jgi:hypothetical protein